MTADTFDWNGARADDYVLWYRNNRGRKNKNHWQAKAIAEMTLCYSMARQMAMEHPRGSVLVLPAYETPVLMPVDEQRDIGGEG